MLDDGGLDCIIPSDGTSSMNPMLLFHGDSIQDGLVEHETNPIMKMGLKMIGPKLFRNYPYFDNYLLEKANRIREHVKKGQVCYIGGASNNEAVDAIMGAGFDFIQLGRPLLFDPDFVKNAMADTNYSNGCTHCNKCAGLIEAPGGIRCVLR